MVELLQQNASKKNQFSWCKWINLGLGCSTLLPGVVTTDQIYAARFLDAWKRAKEQDGSFILPRNIFSGVSNSTQLQQQLARITPIIWTIECGKYTSLEKHRAHHAYRRLSKEAQVLRLCENQLKKFHVTAQRPEPSAALIAMIAKVKLLEHPTVQHLLALSSGLNSNARLPRRRKKAARHCAQSNRLCCDKASHHEESQPQNRQHTVTETQESLVATVSQSTPSPQDILQCDASVIQSQNSSSPAQHHERLHSPYMSCSLQKVEAILWESRYNSTPTSPKRNSLN